MLGVNIDTIDRAGDGEAAEHVLVLRDDFVLRFQRRPSVRPDDGLGRRGRDEAGPHVLDLHLYHGRRLLAVVAWSDGIKERGKPAGNFIGVPQRGERFVEGKAFEHLVHHGAEIRGGNFPRIRIDFAQLEDGTEVKTKRAFEVVFECGDPDRLGRPVLRIGRGDMQFENDLIPVAALRPRCGSEQKTGALRQLVVAAPEKQA